MPPMRLVLLAVLLSAASAVAQNPAFEVASVKPQAGSITGTASSSGTRFHRPSTTLLLLLGFAYDLHSSRIAGGPAWIGSHRWAVDGRASAPATQDEMRHMVRDLLNDRFKLAAHVETRELPTYELHLARGDGTRGPYLRPAAGDCVPRDARTAAELRAAGLVPCGLTIEGFGAGYIAHLVRNVTMAAFAADLESLVGRVVTDKTGLAGAWDYELRFGAENIIRLPQALVGGPRDFPDVFVALREQLGLTLESSKGPVDILVIDSVERPAPD